ncbi:phage tail tube protein [Rufibacter roseus]|uniref:Phage tail tube protein n=1 Tax=Rufibacter roseus TaxID=1567108 RepID=A0ABW2DJL1_9BACT|nr:phage tail tube protein [Rufibacter roseus]
MAVNVLNAQDVIITKDGIVVGCAQSGSLEMSKEELDAVCAASGGWSESSEGRKSWNMSVDSLLREATDADAATNHTFHDAFDLFDTGGIVEVQWQIGSFTYTGQAFMSSLSLSYSSTDAQTWSSSLRGTGPLVKAAVVPVG